MRMVVSILTALALTLGPFAPAKAALTVSAPMRIRIPKASELPLLGERKVVYSDCDENGHRDGPV